jgi:hypothetical protein
MLAGARHERVSARISQVAGLDLFGLKMLHRIPATASPSLLTFPFKESPEEKVRRVGTFAGAGPIFRLVIFDELASAVSRQSCHSVVRRGSCPVCSTNTS